LKPERDAEEQARTLLRALGIPDTASSLYLTLLKKVALPLEEISKLVGLTTPAAEQASSYLKLFRLISLDLVHGRTVLFACNPRNAWKAHDADFYWARSNHIGDVEDLPPLPAMADEQRRNLYAKLEVACGEIYDRNPHSHDPLAHRHRDIHSGELFASWLATAISAAEKQIVAVEMPPRLPDLAPIWVALTRRLKEGVGYTRIVGFDEILEHGLDIVTRDMDEYAIELRVAPPGLIQEGYYVIDKRRLMLKNARGMERDDRGRHFGVYTSNGPIVKRYMDRFSDRYLPASVGARPAVERLRQHAEQIRKQLLADGNAEGAEVFEAVARYGKFVVPKNNDEAVRERLIAQGLLTRNPSGYVVINAPPAQDMLN